MKVILLVLYLFSRLMAPAGTQPLTGWRGAVANAAKTVDCKGDPACLNYTQLLSEGQPIICGEKGRFVTLAVAAKLGDQDLYDWLDAAGRTVRDNTRRRRVWQRMADISPTRCRTIIERHPTCYQLDARRTFEAIYNVARDPAQKIDAHLMFREAADQELAERMTEYNKGARDPRAVRIGPVPKPWTIEVWD